jgi:perosamine synthetase
MNVAEMNVAVIGAGNMGLPIACHLAGKGAKVIACDKQAAVVEAINNGVCPFREPRLAELLLLAVRQGDLRAMVDIRAAVAASEVVIVIVPVLLSPEKEADTSIIESVCAEIGRSINPGGMVCFESTMPVGGIRALLPILESGGLKAGRDFDVVVSPERVKSGSLLQNLSKTPKVVAGFTADATARAEAFYSRYLGAPIITMESMEAAELVKLAGMVYRDVNIALSNELARYADAVCVDIAPVIKAANTDGEACLLSPGIGVGGHCTPVYPYFLTADAEKRGRPASLAEIGRWINEEQPAYVLNQLERYWGPLHSVPVLIAGLGFRPELKESRYSPAWTLRDLLLKRQAHVLLHDPLYTSNEIQALGFVPGELNSGPAPQVLILNTAHGAYRDLDFAELSARGLKVAVDGRNFFNRREVEQAGVLYFGIGQAAKSLLPPPARRISIARPVLSFAEAEAASQVVRSGWVMQGPQVAAFEEEFASYSGAKHACAVSSGTTALHLALLAVGVKPGDEVITVSHSFIATANSIRHCRAIPVFVDIQPNTYNIDPDLIESAISKRTAAILCVHQMGMPCDLDRISRIAKKHSIPLIEDAACAIGGEILWDGRWERIGSPHADVACFSFHPRKILSTGEGGMITTKHKDWDTRFRLWRQHGMSGPDTVRHASDRNFFESYPEIGFNYRMTDIQAAIGREQLKRLPELVSRRREMAARYRSLLGDIPDLGLPAEPEWARSNWQSYCVRLPEHFDQRQVMQALLDHGIATRRGIMCAHREPAYQNQPWRSPGSLSASERAQEECVLLPLYHQLRHEEQRFVASQLRAAITAECIA